MLSDAAKLFEQSYRPVLYVGGGAATTPGLETNKHGCIVTEGDEGKTSREGVYAGGDAVTGAATVIKAMGAGKAAAKAIDEYIQNK